MLTLSTKSSGKKNCFGFLLLLWLSYKTEFNESSIRNYCIVFVVSSRPERSGAYKLYNLHETASSLPFPPWRRKLRKLDFARLVFIVC